MISICIPVFNFDVRDLVKSLHLQSKSLNYKTEIILIDDCSDESYRKINSEICSISNYIQLEKNIGRAKIRNAFLQYASFDYLLFIDCDSIIINPNYLKNYIESISRNLDIVVGGRIYSQVKPDSNKLLRWKYCIRREQKPNADNLSSKKNHFLSNNFLIKKSLFEIIKFDSRITNYGHEDTLFAYELKKAQVDINYIDNPILNNDLEYNEEFIKKTEISIENLKMILELLEFDKDFINEVTLLKNYFRLKKVKLDSLLFLIWKIFRKIIKFLLIKGFVILPLFDLYKIGYLFSIMKLSNKTKTS